MKHVDNPSNSKIEYIDNGRDENDLIEKIELGKISWYRRIGNEQNYL